jgi:lysophospholipase L1-like esterase
VTSAVRVGRALALCLAWIVASVAAAQDGASEATPKGPILVLGDSILAWNEERGASVADVVAAKLGVRTVSAAVPGSRVIDGPDAVPDQYAPGPWSWVIVQGGGNDLVERCGCGPCGATLDRLLGPDGARGAIAELTRRIRADGASVLLWSNYEMPADAPFPFARCNDELAEVRARLARLAAGDPGIVLVDGRAAIPPSRPGLVDRDRVHPSPAGSHAIGTQLAEAIQDAAASP